MRWNSRFAWGLLVCAVAGCSDDGVPAADDLTSGTSPAGTDTGLSGTSSASDSDPTLDPSEGDTDAGTGGPGTDGSTGADDSSGGDSEPTPGVLPEPVPPAGVAYVAHFLSNDLRWYRTDGDSPAAEGVLDLGEVTHDMALDPVHDRLALAQDVARRVVLYGLTRPANAAAMVDDPQQLGAVDLDTAPRFVRFDPYHDRLYALADNVEADGQMIMHTIDVADPEAPIVLSSVLLPASTSWDVDGPRRLLVLFHGQTDEVFAYDVTGDEPAQLGEPIDLGAIYTEENNTAFQPRNLTLDPWNARLYAARSQSALSELIVMDYPDAVPGEGQSYGAVAEFALDPVADPFDLSVDIADRPGILDAYTPLPSPVDALVFMTAAAWNGTLPSATLVTMSGKGPLMLEPGCEDHEGFGCFLRDYDMGTPIAFAQTDGAACRDWTHGVVVTTIVGSPEDEPGQVSFFRYEDDGATTPWLANGDNLAASALPIATVCH